MTFPATVGTLFASYFTRDQVLRSAHYGQTMIINLSAQSAGTAYDVHPLALWILCAAFEHIRGTAKPDKALSYYHENNACASFGSYGTGTPLSRAFYQARRCMYDTRSGCGGFRDADPMVNALAELDGWVPTEKELIALRRGGWSWGFDFARFCPDLPAHDGWSGKGGGML
tara:strand:- start:3002 stop:3514 length:513 start_codon:yes stop_codon:yes gene_type:complete